MNRQFFTDLLHVLNEKEKKGSIWSQIFQISLRVLKITYHLKFTSRDSSSQRSLWKPSGKLKTPPNYLFKIDKDSYNRSVREVGIRGLED
nr:ribosomal protein S15 [Actinostachys digitata]